jgi:thiol:disulfide interchange protein DsbA
MKADRRIFLGQLFAATAGASAWWASALAQAGPPAEGKQYQKLATPQAVSGSGKIEVLEFFSYACPHCYALETYLEPWAKKLPADVTLRRMPVPFLVSAENLMRSYFAFEALGLVDKMTAPMFTAMNVGRQRLATPDEVAALVEQNGGDKQAFLAAMKSFGVQNNVVRAKKLMTDYGVDSTPTFIVQGRFMTSPATAGGHPQALEVTDFLIDKVRRNA